MNNQTESNPPAAPKLASTPEPTPAPRLMEEHVYQLQRLLWNMEDAVKESPEPVPSDPNFAKSLDDQTLMQQLGLAIHLQTLLHIDGTDNKTAANLRQTLALIERTRARHDRKKKAEDIAPQQPDRDEARHFLQTELSRGDRPATELISLARAIGITPRTLKRAKADLNITSHQRINNQSRAWHWSLPRSPQTDEASNQPADVVIAQPESQPSPEHEVSIATAPSPTTATTSPTDSATPTSAPSTHNAALATAALAPTPDISPKTPEGQEAKQNRGPLRK